MTDELEQAAQHAHDLEAQLHEARRRVAELAAQELERGVPKTVLKRRTGFSTKFFRENAASTEDDPGKAGAAEAALASAA